MYDEHMTRINEEVSKLKHRHVELISLVQEVVSVKVVLIVLLVN